MAKKSKQSPNKTINISAKQGGTALLIVALLILGVNWLLNQNGESLPDEVTNAAESIVADSLEEMSLEEEVPQAVEEPVAEATSAEATLASSGQVVSNANSDTTTNIPWVTADGDFDYYILALSWQPAFCETKQYKPECASQNNGRFDATNFVLHGLWPNQNDDPAHTFAYCGQSNDIINTDKDSDWCELPDLPLSAAVESDLNIFMPGAESCLDHHEWYKHGTCAGMSADTYFALSNGLVSSFAQTAFNQYVASQIGNEVSRNDLLNRFEDEFGAGSDDYLSLRCNEVNGTSLLSEIRLALKQDLAELDDFSEMFPEQSVSPQGNCPTQFVIDSVS
jgi:ribonuclease T2